MGTPNFPKNINFTTTSVGYDLLQDTNIKEALKVAIGLSEEQYQAMILKTGISGIYFDIFVSNTRISINDTPYEHGELLSNAIFSTNDYVQKGIKNVKVEDSGIQGTFSFNKL